MTPHHSKSAVRKKPAHWDGRDFLGRLDLILNNHHLFRSFGLVTEAEIQMAQSIPESAREYILTREDQPIFTTINLKTEAELQRCWDRFKQVLKSLN